MSTNFQDELLEEFLDHDKNDDEHISKNLSLTNELQFKKLKIWKRVLMKKMNNWFKNRKSCRSWCEGRYHPPKIQERKKIESEVEKLIMKELSASVRNNKVSFKTC